MRTSALKFLCCPNCRQALRLEPRVSTDGDVDSGWLVCSTCPEAHPIVRGVPRFVPSHRYAVHSDLQWRIFRAVHYRPNSYCRVAEADLAACTGWRNEEYQGRLVLDVGAGGGTRAEVIARHGGEVVSVDFNAAVDAAYSRLRQFRTAHVIQADLWTLPLRDGLFDLAYSMRALHQTPCPALAFARIAQTVGASGEVAVLLDARGAAACRIGAQVRRLTTRLPLSVTLALTAGWSAAAGVGRLPLVGRALEALSPLRIERHWRDRWLAAFEWGTATYHWPLTPAEVAAWMRASDIPELPHVDGRSGLRGRKVPDGRGLPRYASKPRLVAQGSS